MQVCFTTFGHQTNQLWIAEDVPVIASTLYSEVKCSLVRGVPIKKQSPRKNLCISALVVWIYAKLSDFVCEHSHNVPYRFHWSN